MNNENLDPSRNIIILRSVWGKVGMKYLIQPCKNPKTGNWFYKTIFGRFTTIPKRSFRKSSHPL